MNVPKLDGVKSAGFKPQFKYPEYFSRYPASAVLSFFLIALSPILFSINLVFSLFSLSAGLILLAYMIMLEEYGNETEVMANLPDTAQKGKIAYAETVIMNQKTF